MTYLAPRQGLFAIILLISFCIQSLLLIVSTERQLDEVRVQTGERMMSQLIDEAKLPLLSQDRVSLSVIAARYTADDNVASLTIRNPDDAVLVQTGAAPLQAGEQIRQEASNGDKVLGSITLTLNSSNKGEIIATQWPFLLGSFILNLLVWLLYGYVARPTKAQLAALSRDIQAHFLAQQPRNQRLRRDESSKEAQFDQANAEQNANSDKDTSDPALMAALLGHGSLATQTEKMQGTTESVDRHQALNQYLQSQQKTEQNVSQDKQTSQPKSSSPVLDNEAFLSSKQKNDGELNKGIETVCIHIHYSDPYNLISVLAPEKAVPYFTLCTQLLQQGIDELLAQPLFYGISLVNKPKFDAQGAVVVLKASNSHAKIGLAAVVLGKLYVMLNQIIVAKHHELKQFAADVKVGVSDESQEKPMLQLIENVGQANEVITLLPTEGIKQLSGHIQLRNLSNPMTVYERESAFVEGINEAMLQRLVGMRDAVLLSN
ncbi:hypothetical protein [Psychrobacter sp. I-STPA10]|uniref:hypothetical protein n=1 Tax=Psychrobacter sp. I-STPA10 TaxID=2585769 RepID=UPI001E336DBF|nr:hypothetical protein [Psychrobacter sp. I-STPA10]